MFKNKKQKEYAIPTNGDLLTQCHHQIHIECGTDD